jgi:hypothetical protein
MRRSRKPVWAVSSIEGSNPSLSAKQGAFWSLCRDNGRLQAVADGVVRGSTRASVGPSPRGFVPSTFPPDTVAFVHIEQSPGGFQHAHEPFIGEQRRSAVGEQSTLARTSADRHVITAGRGGHPFQEVVE